MTLFELTQLLKEQRKSNELKEHNKYEHQREVLGQKNVPVSWQDFRGDFT
uniref:Uncharacterized protein n=1 Tax=Arsenophonus endosymbiont of Trialeurodes vaporariorum TaxID=235567 RepID=A0A3B0MK52_9GAMM